MFSIECILWRYLSLFLSTLVSFTLSRARALSLSRSLALSLSLALSRSLSLSLSRSLSLALSLSLSLSRSNFLGRTLSLSRAHSLFHSKGTDVGNKKTVLRAQNQKSKLETLFHRFLVTESSTLKHFLNSNSHQFRNGTDVGYLDTQISPT